MTKCQRRHLPVHLPHIEELSSNVHRCCSCGHRHIFICLYLSALFACACVDCLPSFSSPLSISIVSLLTPVSCTLCPVCSIYTLSCLRSYTFLIWYFPLFLCSCCPYMTTNYIGQNEIRHSVHDNKLQWHWLFFFYPPFFCLFVHFVQPVIFQS